MLSNQAKSLNASKLRILLICSMVLLLAVSVVAFWFFRTQLEAYSTQVQADNAAASVSAKDVTRLQELQRKLEDDKVAVTRAKSIVADSKYYQYQDQIIDDLTTYAKKAGVSITAFTFSADGKSTGASPVQAGPPAPAAGGGASAGAAAAPAQIPGVKTTTASITVKSPVKYTDIMNFVHLVEVNLTKMQLTGITLTRLGNGNVQLNPLTIEVYTR